MDSLDVDLLNSLNVSAFSDLRPLPVLISYGTIRQFWPRNVTSAFQKCGFCRRKEIFSGPNPRSHLDFLSFTHTATVSNFPPRHTWQPIAEHSPSPCSTEKKARDLPVAVRAHTVWLPLPLLLHLSFPYCPLTALFSPFLTPDSHTSASGSVHLLFSFLHFL